MRLLISCLILLTLTNCVSKNKPETNSIEFCLFESYTLPELASSFNEANTIIRKYQLDSIAKNKTGFALLDAMNEEAANDDSLRVKTFDDYPLFSVFIPNTKTGNNGENYMDTSAVLGWTTDTVKLKKYFDLYQKVFPEGLTWAICKGFSNKYLCLHAFKNQNKVSLKENDIDSFYIKPIGLNSFGGVFEKMSDLKGISKFRLDIKLNSQLSDLPGGNSYTLVLKVNSSKYSGSVVNFKKYPNQYIVIGEIGATDFQALKSKFESKMKIRN